MPGQKINFTSNVLFAFGFFLFCLFSTFMVAFNRGFAYFHIRVGALPLYATEAFLGVSILLLILTKEGRSALFRVPVRTHLTLASIGLIGVLLIKFSPHFHFDLYALRHSALGYYVLFALISYVYALKIEWRRWLFVCVLTGTLVAAVLVLVTRSGQFPNPPALIGNFQGVGAFLWIGVVSIYLLSHGLVHAGRHPWSTLVFLILTSVGFLVGSRSFILGMILCCSVVIGLQYKKVDRIMIASLGVIFFIVIGLWGLRKANVIRFTNQDVWQDGWSSWREMVQMHKELKKAQKEMAREQEKARAKARLEQLKKTEVKQKAEQVKQPANVVMKEATQVKAEIKPVDQPRIKPASVIEKEKEPLKRIETVAPLPIEKKKENNVRGLDFGQLRKWGIPPYSFETEQIDHIYLNYQLALKKGGVVKGHAYLQDEDRLILMSPVLGPSFAEKGFGSKAHNAFWRLELWRLAVGAAVSHYPLLGFPLGTNVMYWAFGPHSYTQYADLHNSHLAFFFRFGLLGFGLYIFILYWVFRDVTRAFLAKRNPDHLAIGLGLVFIAIISSFNVVLEGPYGAFPFWSLLGYAVALCHPNSSK